MESSVYVCVCIFMSHALNVCLQHAHDCHNYYSWKFSPVLPLLSVVKFLSVNFLCCVNEYIEDMAAFMALAKI